MDRWVGRVAIVTGASGGIGASIAQELVKKDGPVESWKLILDLNVLALSICTKEAIQSMKDSGVDGHIIHINSTLGHVIPPGDLGLSMYSASKHAVTALTEGLRKELVKNNSKIRITSVSPGLVKTDFFTSSGTTPGTPEMMYSTNPHLHPKDVADCVVFALSLSPHAQVSELTLQAVGERF
ncbi:hypothetical protein C0J52_00908 [Blattella germanica]|nr:hypothetical protein C0J52_00908 [Blattella germanica]